MEEDIEGLKRLFYANSLTQYGKRKIINYYEQRNKELEEENKKLKDNYKNQIEHTTILAKALNLEEDAPIDEIYAEINNLKTNSIPTSVIQKKIDEYREKRNNLADGHFWDNKRNINEDTSLFIAIETLKLLLEEGRNNK